MYHGLYILWILWTEFSIDPGSNPFLMDCEHIRAEWWPSALVRPRDPGPYLWSQRPSWRHRSICTFWQWSHTVWPSGCGCPMLDSIRKRHCIRFLTGSLDQLSKLLCQKLFEHQKPELIKKIMNTGVIQRLKKQSTHQVIDDSWWVIAKNKFNCWSSKLW